MSSEEIYCNLLKNDNISKTGEKKGKMDNLYIPVEIQTIQYDAIQSFDIFFKTGGGKIVLYCAGGEVVKEEIRKNIQEHSIENFYILEKDKLYYDLYVEKILSSILNDPQISTQVKTKTAYDSIVNAAKLVFESSQSRNNSTV